MYSFSDNSKKVLKTLHPDLQLSLDMAIKYSSVDFTLVEGYRSIERQFELYKQGRIYSQGIWKVAHPKEIVTDVDGYRIKSKHNYSPSRAVDICVYIPGRPDLNYDIPHLSIIAGTILGISKYMYSKNKINHEVLWGANWDNDGMIIYDHTLKDLPHFELL